MERRACDSPWLHRPALDFASCTSLCLAAWVLAKSVICAGTVVFNEGGRWVQLLPLPLLSLIHTFDGKEMSLELVAQESGE